MRDASGPAPAWKSEFLIDLVGIAILAVVVSVVVLRNEFTQDDTFIIQTSSRLHGLGAWREILTRPYWPPPASEDLYRPALSLLLALQYAIGDGAPVVFRIVSVLLYAGLCASVYALAARILSRIPALLAAALFAVHPVHVEPLTLAVAQNELIVTLLAVLCARAYISWRRTLGSLGWRRWGLLIAAYAVAALSKENGFVLPALLLASELLIPAEDLRSRVRHTWAGFAGLAAIGVVILAVRTSVLGGRMAASIAAEAIQGQGPGGRLLTALRAVPEWTRLLLWPKHLRAEYSPQEFVASTGFSRPEAIGLLIVIAAVVVAIRLRRTKPVVALSIAWTALALLPVSGVLLPSGIVLAERTLLLPSVGVALAAGGLCAWSMAADRVRREARTFAIAAAALVVVAGATRSIGRFRIWRNAQTLTLYSMTDSPRSWRVQQAYGDLLFDAGRVGEASLAFEKAIAYAPQTWRPRNRFAERLWQVHDDSLALEQLQRSLAENPGRIETLMRLPAGLLAVGDYEGARRLADSIIVAENAPPVMVAYRVVADSAIKLKAPPGTVRVFPF
jgi:hypothetical protein